MLPFLLVLQKSVLLEHRVATVEAVVHELAQKTGQDLRIKRELKDEVLYVALKAHEPKVLMQLIARAVSAEWIDDGGTYLGRSNSLRNRQQREDRAAWAAKIGSAMRPMLAEDDSVAWKDAAGRAKALADFARASPSSYGPGEFQQRRARLSAMTPCGRFLSRALRSIPPSELASIPRGATMRFALKPNRAQRALGATAGLRQYQEERAAFALDTASLSPERRREADLEIYYGGASAGSETLLTPLLCVHRWSQGPMDLTLSMIGGQGQVVDGARMMFNPTLDQAVASLPRYSQWSHQPLLLGPRTTSFMAALTGEQRDAVQKAKLRDPAVNEPLAELLTEPMDTLRAAMGVEEALVALPDETARDAGEQLESKPKLGQFADGLARDVVSEVKDGLWLGRARYPSETSASKTNRAVLGTFFRDFAPLPSLKAVAQYALAQNPTAAVSNFEQLALTGAGIAPDADVLNGLLALDMGGRDLLRAYGALPETVRSSLDAGGTVRASQLSPGVRADFEEILFRRGNDLEPVDRSGSQIDPTLVIDSLSPDAVLSYANLRTDLIASYPLKGQLRLMEMGSLGYVLENQEREGTFNEQGGYPIVASVNFVPGRKRSFALNLLVAPKFQYRGYLRDTRLDGGNPVPIGNLPPEHTKEFRRVYDYYRKLREG